MLINILGPGRSGTTMLDLMLGSDRESFSLGEVHALFHPFRPHHLQIDCNCGNVACSIWESLRKTDEKGFHARAFEELGVKFLIDSSKFLPWVIDNNLRAGSNFQVQNFVLYKPFKDYAHSIWKRGESLEDALYRYKLYYRRLNESGLPFRSVLFSELTSDTEATLAKIISITGQNTNEGREQFWRHDHHHLFGSGGVRLQTRAGNSDIRAHNDVDPAFEDAVAKNPLIFEDCELKSLLKMLHEHNVNLGKIETPQSGGISKRWWYYALKAKESLSTLKVYLTQRWKS